jgi:hypothetical protein
MEQLNSDCLLIICEKLSVQDWINLLLVCRNINKIIQELSYKLFRVSVPSPFVTAHNFAVVTTQKELYIRNICVLNYVTELFPTGIRLLTVCWETPILPVVDHISNYLKSKVYLTIIFEYNSTTYSSTPHETGITPKTTFRSLITSTLDFNRLITKLRVEAHLLIDK